MTRRGGAAAVVAAAVTLLAIAAPAHAQRNTIDNVAPAHVGVRPSDPAPIVELYTFGVGEVVFEKFGHAALCLTYPDRSRPPMCFNYGVTNFADPSGLIWGFMRSQQLFWVEPTYLSTMIRFYRGSDRDIWAQHLPLTDEQARAIAAKVWGDVVENRDYIYHHFDDNCTTRLRDIVDDATGGVLRADSTGRHPLTFREFGTRGMSEFTMLIGMSDFITGRALDRQPTMWQAMFHPDELRKAVTERLGVEPRMVYQRRGPPFPTTGSTGRPWVVLLSLLLTAPLVIARWRGRGERAALVVACVPLIAFGFLLYAIFAIVSIDWVRWNEAMLVFVPTDVVLPFLGAARRRRYAQLRVGMVVLASMLCAIGVLDQPLWVPLLVAFLPLAVIGFDLPPLRVRVGRDQPGAATEPAEPAAA